MATTRSDAWIVRRAPRTSPRLRLFCFPYAGGSAQIYWTWSSVLPADIEICAIQLPGRERRFREAPFRRVEAAVDALAGTISTYLDTPFAMFGHSMGAVLAFETTRRLAAEFGRAADRLIVSGHRAPHLRSRRTPIHSLPDDSFIEKVRALNGTPAEVFDNAELVELILPMLKADFEMVETYSELAGPRLTCPLLAMGGNADADVTPAEIDAWHSATTGQFRSVVLEGGHFYINTATDRLLATLRDVLAQ